MTKEWHRFKRDLSESEGAVDTVLAWLLKYKAKAVKPPIRVAPTQEQAANYLDGGDILIEQRVEVKHNRAQFTGEEDYPYDEVIVDEWVKIRRIPRTQLWGYILLNRDKTHAIIVHATKMDLVEQRTMYDAKQGSHRTFGVIAKEFCDWREVRL